ncbi:MAG: hypothetical protein KDA61_20065, partial [Planctomycetales bacterium]|nr:hypothetical protein [Planctomycetales bacterium]
MSRQRQIRDRKRRCARTAIRFRRRSLRMESLETRQVLDGATLAADAFVMHQNAPEATLDVLVNDHFDADYVGARRITALSFGSEGGQLHISDDGRSVKYSPPADFAGVEQFTYVVDNEFTAQATITIDAPLQNDSYDVPPDGRVRLLDVLANDPFWAGYNGPRRITATSVASRGGTVEITSDGLGVNYTPSLTEFGSESFVYIVDGVYPARVTITSEAPLAADQYEMLQGEAKVLHVLANDPFYAGYNGERRITRILDAPDDATITINADQSISYQASTTSASYRSFRYVVDDLYEATAALRIYNPVVSDSAELDVNSVDFYLDLTNNDGYYDRQGIFRRYRGEVTSVDAGDAGGTLVIADGGRGVVYTPAAEYLGVENFSYLIDGRFAGRVTFRVNSPVRDDFAAVYQDTHGNPLRVLTNDFIGNGYTGDKRITAVSVTENGGTVTIFGDGSDVLYAPPAGFLGVDRFTYDVDGFLVGSVSVNVQPLAESDSFRFGVNPPQGAILLDVLQNDHFSGFYSGAGVVTAVSDPSGEGAVQLVDGRIYYTPRYAGYESFTYTVDGKYEAQASVYFPNGAYGDQSIVDQNSTGNAIAVLANDFNNQTTRGYAGPRRLTAVGATNHGGTVSIAPDGVSVIYTPAADFYGEDTFTYTIDDWMQGVARVQTVRRVRDDVFRVGVDAPSELLTVLANDPFAADYSGAGQITRVTPSEAGGEVRVAADGQAVAYAPPAGFVGVDRFSYFVDGTQRGEVEVVVGVSAEELAQTFGSTKAYEDFLIDDALKRYENVFGQPAYQWWSGPIFFDTT